MKKVYQSFISILLVFSLLASMTLTSFATAKNNKVGDKVTLYEDHETIVEMYTDLSGNRILNQYLNQEKFVNSFWVIILLVAVGIYFWVIPKNSIAEAYSKKKHYNLKKTSRFLAVGFWIIAISCVPVLISLWFDTPWICIICVILLVLGTSVLHDYESGGKLK